MNDSDAAQFAKASETLAREIAKQEVVYGKVESLGNMAGNFALIILVLYHLDWPWWVWVFFFATITVLNIIGRLVVARARARMKRILSETVRA